jgi:hypothetical protein
VLTLAVVVFVGAVTGAGATSQPTKSSEQTTMLSIAPRASRGVVSEGNTCLAGVPAPSNCGLRMAQYSCDAGCNMVYQQGAGQCEGFRMYGNQQYSACMMQVQQNAQVCMQRCRSGTLPSQGMSYCQQYPGAACCRAGTC